MNDVRLIVSSVVFGFGITNSANAQQTTAMDVCLAIMNSGLKDVRSFSVSENVGRQEYREFCSKSERTLEDVSKLSDSAKVSIRYNLNGGDGGSEKLDFSSLTKTQVNQICEIEESDFVSSYGRTDFSSTQSIFAEIAKDCAHGEENVIGYAEPIIKNSNRFSARFFRTGGQTAGDWVFLGSSNEDIQCQVNDPNNGDVIGAHGARLVGERSMTCTYLGKLPSKMRAFLVNGDFTFGREWDRETVEEVPFELLIGNFEWPQVIHCKFSGFDTSTEKRFASKEIKLMLSPEDDRAGVRFYRNNFGRYKQPDWVSLAFDDFTGEQKGNIGNEGQGLDYVASNCLNENIQDLIR